jgi:formylmethanofuran dehydrogenase subunit E-like metal-binding protein
LATYTGQFYSYELKQGATVDIISNDLHDLQAYIFTTDPNKALTEKSKISTLLRAVRKLGTGYLTRIKILKDKILTLDYDSVVISLKETKQRLKSKVTKDTNAIDEQASTANDRKNKRLKRSGKGPG